MFEEEAPLSGRRSKLEITCDILVVISKGTEKPTRIMQLANVTWDDLIMYLEVLIRNQLISRKVHGKRVTYSLTDEGSTLLDHYLKLKRQAAPLRLEMISKERISKGWTFPARAGSLESDSYSSLEKRIKDEGTEALDPKIVGKSGSVYILGAVTRKKDGSKHGYVVIREVDEMQIIKLFVVQVDADLTIHAYYSGVLSPKVAALARVYSLELFPLGGRGDS